MIFYDNTCRYFFIDYEDLKEDLEEINRMTFDGNLMDFSQNVVVVVAISKILLLFLLLDIMEFATMQSVLREHDPKILWHYRANHQTRHKDNLLALIQGSQVQAVQ